jgi:hypothetical protein
LRVNYVHEGCTEIVFQLIFQIRLVYKYLIAVNKKGCTEIVFQLIFQIRLVYKYLIAVNKNQFFSSISCLLIQMDSPILALSACLFAYHNGIQLSYRPS